MHFVLTIFFCTAQALLEHLKTNTSYCPTMDMSQEIVALLIDLMTVKHTEAHLCNLCYYHPTLQTSPVMVSAVLALQAQAVEMQWEKKMLIKLDEDSVQTLVLYAQHVKAVSNALLPVTVKHQ